MMKQQLYRLSALMLLLITICAAPAFAKSKAKVNDAAPAFNATGIDGQKISLAELKGKTVVLNFWFIQCGPCRKEMPTLNVLADKYKNNNNVVFISFAMNDAAELKTFFETNPFFYQTVPDAGAISNSYSVNMFPTNIVVDKTGKIVYRKAGYNESTVKKLEEAVEKSLHKQF